MLNLCNTFIPIIKELKLRFSREQKHLCSNTMNTKTNLFLNTNTCVQTQRTQTPIVNWPLLRMLDQDRLLEMSLLPTSERQSWTIKTSSPLEKPRFVIVAFQTARKDDLAKHDMIDKCNIKEVKLYLRSQQYPFDSFRADLALMYEDNARIQSSYYGKLSQPIIEASDYLNNPIFVIGGVFQIR